VKKLITSIIAICLLFAIVRAGVITWDTRDHYLNSDLPGWPDGTAFHMSFKPSLGAGAGSHDFGIGPFSLSGLPYYPTSVCIIFQAWPWDVTTNDDVNAWLAFETRGDSIAEVLGDSVVVPHAAFLLPVVFTDSAWLKTDSIKIDNAQDSTYPGDAELNAGNAIEFDFPPNVYEWRLYFDVIAGSESLEKIDMIVNYIP